MAFENVDVNSARVALNSCLSTLDYSGVKRINSNISSSALWQSAAKNNICASLNDTEVKGFEAIKNKINQYLGVIDLIEQYKKLQDENKNLKFQNSMLQNRLYRTETMQINLSSGSSSNQTKQVRDDSVYNQMNNIQNKINNNLKNMKSLENKINGSV